MGADNKPKKVYYKTSGESQLYGLYHNKRLVFEGNENHPLIINERKKKRSSVKNRYTLPMGKALTYYGYMEKKAIEYPEQKHIVDPYCFG
jgi:hypothetical protein